MNRHLLDAIDKLWGFNAGYFINCWCYVDDVMKLCSQFTCSLDVLRPRNGNCIAGATKVRSDLLHPLKWRVERPCPADIEVVLAASSAEIIDVIEQPLRIFGYAVLK